MKTVSRALKTLARLVIAGFVLTACGSSSDDDFYTYGTAGDQEFFTIAKFSDGGYLLGGNTEDVADGPFSAASSGSPDYYLVRTNSSGDVVWAKTFGDENADFITKVIQATDSNIVVAGNSIGDDNTYNGQVVKLDSNGGVLWAVEVNAGENELLWDMKELSDGSLLVVGAKFDNETFVSDAIISKFSSDGELIWQKTYGDEADELVLDVLELADGSFVAVGNKTTDSNTNMVFWQLSSTGNLVAETQYGGTGYESASGIVAASGGFLITGTAIINGTNDITLLRIDSTGVVVWQKYYGDDGNDTGSESVATSDGGFVAVGTDARSDTDKRMIVLKVNSSGEELWEKTYGGDGLNFASDIVNTDDGFAVSGYGDSEGAGGLDGYLLLLDDEGDLL